MKINDSEMQAQFVVLGLKRLVSLKLRNEIPLEQFKSERLHLLDQFNSMQRHRPCAKK